MTHAAGCILLCMHMSSKCENAFCYILLINSHGHVNKSPLLLCSLISAGLFLLHSIFHRLVADCSSQRKKSRMHYVGIAVSMCTMTQCHGNLQLWIGSLICVQTYTHTHTLECNIFIPIQFTSAVMHLPCMFTIHFFLAHLYGRSWCCWLLCSVLLS